MFYSELLAGLSKQEKNPVNRMYLNELNMKWKLFDELQGTSSSTNEELAENLSRYLDNLHNRKFIFSKTRNSGFHHNSPLFSAYYLHDLISALMQRHEIIKRTGMFWGFNEFDYNHYLTDQDPQLNSEKPVISSVKSPPVLSLCQKLDIQYRISGKRNFTKSDLVLPYLMFFAYKNPKLEHCFMIEHYARIAVEVSRFVQVFVVCETMTEYRAGLFDGLPVSIYGLKNVTRGKNTPLLSAEMIGKLDEAITSALNPQIKNNINLLKRQAGSDTRRTYNKPQRKRGRPRKKQ